MQHIEIAVHFKNMNFKNLYRFNLVKMADLDVTVTKNAIKLPF
jgi:hypothetical protein